MKSITLDTGSDIYCMSFFTLCPWGAWQLLPIKKVRKSQDLPTCPLPSSAKLTFANLTSWIPWNSPCCWALRRSHRAIYSPWGPFRTISFLNYDFLYRKKIFCWKGYHRKSEICPNQTNPRPHLQKSRNRGLLYENLHKNTWQWN